MALFAFAGVVGGVTNVNNAGVDDEGFFKADFPNGRPGRFCSNGQGCHNGEKCCPFAGSDSGFACCHRNEECPGPLDNGCTVRRIARFVGKPERVCKAGPNPNVGDPNTGCKGGEKCCPAPKTATGFICCQADEACPAEDGE